MKSIKECEYNKYAYRIAVDGDVLENKTIEEQLKLMDEYQKIKDENCSTPKTINEFSTALSEIHSKENLNLYLKQLKNSMGLMLI